MTSLSGQIRIANSVFGGKTVAEAVELILTKIIDYQTDSSKPHFYNYPAFAIDLKQADTTNLKQVFTNAHPNDYDASTLEFSEVTDNGAKFKVTHTFAGGGKHEYFGEALSTYHTLSGSGQT